jgi:four helix bundle protein
MSLIQSYKDLIVWQKAMELVVGIYKITENFPKEELYSLTSQLRRCAISIPSNIAEGSGRGTRKDYAQFLRVSLGSCNELSTQIEIAKRLSKTKIFSYCECEKLLEEISKMLKVIIGKLLTPSS